MRKSILCLCAVASLAACDLIPRGAGLQSEVLAATRESGDDVVQDFAIETVTRENLVTFLHWPRSGPSDLRWINRVDQPNNRIIRSGDTVDITIWTTETGGGLLTSPGQRNVQLPGNRVSSSGTIFMPYLGDLRISGMSPERARERIEERYSETMPSVQVQLSLTEGTQQTVSLIEGVKTPGSYPLPDNDYTLLQLLADGGGIVDSLVNPQVRLQRDGTLYGISATRLLNEPRRNTTLSGGDRVFVQSDERTFLSLGAAGTEAVHSFPSDTVTALEAMSIIGGVSDTRADAKGILILRRYSIHDVTADRTGPDHPRTVFTLDLTTADGLFSAGQFEIQPDDLIYVTESPITAAQSLIGVFAATLGLGRQL